MSAISQAFDKAKAKITAELQDAGLVQQPDVGDVKPKESFIQRLPIEVIERVGDYVAFPGDSPKGQDNSFRGPSIVNPFTGKTISSQFSTILKGRLFAQRPAVYNLGHTKSQFA